MPSLDAIESEILNVLTALDDLEDEGGDQDGPGRAELERAILPYLEGLMDQERRKVDAVAFIDRRSQSEIEYLKAEEERLRSRRKVLEARRERFRSHLAQVMLKHDLKKIVGRESCLELRQACRVELEVGPQHLPEEYVEVRIDYVPRKDAIREALRRGEEVPGARLARTSHVGIK